MTYVTYSGYGIDLSAVDMKSNAEKILYDMAKNVDFCKESHEEWLEDLEDSWDPELTAEDVDDFINHYESIIKEGNDGLEGFLADLLNENECKGQDTFVYEDCVLHVIADIPKDEKARDHMITQEQIQKLIEKYVGPLIKKPVKCDWYTIQNM